MGLKGKRLLLYFFSDFQQVCQSCCPEHLLVLNIFFFQKNFEKKLEKKLFRGLSQSRALTAVLSKLNFTCPEQTFRLKDLFNKKMEFIFFPKFNKRL